MSSVVAEIFRQAGALNREDPRRRGNVVTLGAKCEVQVAGDIHGNRAGLAKIIGAARMDSRPNRRLILQEIIHGPIDPRSGRDRSVELLLRAARLKIARPQQVLFLLGNHDVAQITGSEITKDGHGVCKEFVAGVSYAYREDAEEVMNGICEFLVSPPLAILCPNGVFMSHSLPAGNRTPPAGTEILYRPCDDADFRRGGAVYEWTWGRGHTAEQLDGLAAELGVEFFILGHRHVPLGWERIAERGVSISSDQQHGVIIDFHGDRELVADRLEEYVKPIAALGQG